jgi:hypothetical protein
MRWDDQRSGSLAEPCLHGNPCRLYLSEQESMVGFEDARVECAISVIETSKTCGAIVLARNSSAIATCKVPVGQRYPLDASMIRA